MKRRHDIKHKDIQHTGLICDTQQKWHSAQMTFSIMTFTQHSNIECRYSEFHDNLNVMLSVTRVSLCWTSLDLVSLCWMSLYWVSRHLWKRSFSQGEAFATIQRTAMRRSGPTNVFKSFQAWVTLAQLHQNVLFLIKFD